jgi:hypothetical protein
MSVSRQHLKILEKYSAQERPLAKKNIENMLRIVGNDKKIITIFDRGYASLYILFHLKHMPTLYLFRLQSDIYAQEKNSMKNDDEIVNLKITKDRQKNFMDEELKMKAKQAGGIDTRLVRVVLSTGEVEYLIANIPYDLMDTKEIGQLCFKRWGIETAYDVIKNKLHIEIISGRKKVIIEQDFYAQILLFNMVEDLKNDANKQLEENKNKDLKYEYKVNMNILIGTFKEYIIKIAV